MIYPVTSVDVDAEAWQRWVEASWERQTWDRWKEQLQLVTMMTLTTSRVAKDDLCVRAEYPHQMVVRLPAEIESSSGDKNAFPYIDKASVSLDVVSFDDLEHCKFRLIERAWYTSNFSLNMG